MSVDERTAQRTADTLIDVRNLRTYFHLAEGVVRAVDGVDLVIRRGQTLGVVGESGCGKSMTAHSIMRIVPSPGQIEEGEILFHRQAGEGSTFSATEVIDLAQLKPSGKEIRDIRGNEISMVFQEPMTALSPVLSVGHQISEAIVLHQQVSKTEARAIGIDMLTRVKMPNPENVFDSYPFELSGGMRQRAVIAMALSCTPSLLIADEPTTALDVTTEAQILDLMRGLQQMFDTAIMYITHNLAVVAEIAQDVLVMYMGKDVELAPVEELFFDPLHPYTRALLKSIPRIDDEQEMLAVMRGNVPDPYALPKGCPFHPRCESAMPICRQEVELPHATPSPGHSVRCHLYS